jgi:predicted transcriptional regulator
MGAFKSPSELMVVPKKKISPSVSCRIPADTKNYLEAEADRVGQTLGWLMAQALQQYAEWLKSKKK